MIITREHQQAMVDKFAESHSAYAVLGYITGLNDMLELISHKLNDGTAHN